MALQPIIYRQYTQQMVVPQLILVDYWFKRSWQNYQVILNMVFRVWKQLFPYKVGTYLGTKKSFNIELVFSQPNGSAIADVLEI
jgi:membrane protease YdiL (CAAX protease family)